MGIIAIDLGTTNIKVAAYSNDAQQLALFGQAVIYQRSGAQVEFDPEVYFDHIVTMLRACQDAAFAAQKEPVQIVLTGQAESLVVLDTQGRTVRPGISWLDMRSELECQELKQNFPPAYSYPVTGQPEIIPTWPLTKILWLRRHETENFEKISHFLLLKDYIQYRLTGRFCGEYSIYGFSHYFDLQKKCYWEEALRACGVRTEQLPELVPPCSVIGEVRQEVLRQTGLVKGSYVNVGTLDHFAGMIGTGNLEEGTVSESAGTVSSIAAFSNSPNFQNQKIPIYCGPFPESYVYLPVCESGGISLDWFRTQFLGDCDFTKMNERVALRHQPGELLFLPYITGVNPPEFDPNVSGAFLGIRAEHDKFDFALAVMSGVASLLRKNIEFFRNNGITVDQIITTGGGSRSELWCQLKANFCGLPVVVPDDEQAPCLGAAIIGSVQSGAYSSFSEAAAARVHMKKTYFPTEQRSEYEKKYKIFLDAYEALRPVYASAASLRERI